jgi:ElaB/YqjD/DUF883 family membrane-anchored ribosome-binding protein
MTANANDHTADNVYRATKDAAADFRRRAGATKEFASDEMRAFLTDVEDLLKRVSSVSDEDIARVRAKVAGSIGDIRRAAGDTADTLRDRARYAADAADEYVHDQPWMAIGIAALAGVLLGVGLSTAVSRR